MSLEKSVPVREKNTPTTFHSLLAVLPYPVAVLDATGRIHAASDHFWAALSLAPQSIDHLRELMSDPANLEPAENRRVVLKSEALNAPVGGTIHELGQGQTGLLLLVLTEAASTRQSLIEALPIGLFFVNSQGEIVAFNSSLAGLVGTDRGNFVDRAYEEFIDHLSDRASEPEVVQGSLRQAVAAVNERPVVEIALGDPAQHLEITLFPVFQVDWSSPGWGGLVEDITEARDQLAWKLELLSILAHDLRTPLATLKGHATALLANYERWGDSMVAEFLEAMDRGTDELVRQVDRSLALTRVETGRLGLRPEAAAPKDLVQGAIERAASALDETSVEQHLPSDLPSVRADPARIEEVLVNLLDNAVRYSPAREPIEVRAQQDEAMLIFSVQDSGPGVPAEDHDSIFEKHSRDPSGDHDGPGLGLFISRKIVEAHGGRIWVISPPPDAVTGARFSFSVPVVPEQPLKEDPVVPKKPHAPRSEAASHILVVEDEPDLQSLLRTILTEAGYDVTLVAGGPRAIDHLSAQAPDLVVLDLSLPRMDGFTVCRAMRRWSDVPILVLTSKSSPEDLVAAVDAGADDYLTKPFRSAELLARLRALLRRRERWGRSESRPAPLRAEGLTVDEARREARLDGESVDLTPTEFELLAHLARHRGQVLTHQQLIEHLWPQGKGNQHALFVHINRLRDKLEPDSDQPHYIVTRWGVGYTFLPRRSP